MASTLQLLRPIRATLAVSLAVCGLLYMPLTWHWPLVGDASLIHYIAFLIERGWAPYRQLGDMNMPGSFLIELAAMHVFGPGALAWRLFDFSVCLCGALGMFAVCGWRNWFATLFASSLFVLIHGRDGLAQGGQRDLTMAVCLLGATACVLAFARRRAVAAAIGFGLLSGVAVTIKPTALLLTAAQVAVVWRTLAAQRRTMGAGLKPDTARSIAAAGLAWLAAPALCLLFLVREDAVRAFLAGLHGVVPYYSSLGHRPLGYVLVHSLSPVEPLVALWLAVLLFGRPPLRKYLDLRHQLLLMGVAFGIAHCILQHRAFPYYRYPLLAFLLPTIALDLTRAGAGWVTSRGGASPEPVRNAGLANRTRGLSGAVALAGVIFGGVFLAPQSALLIHRFRWYQMDMLDSLQQNLQQLGGSALSGRVQCIEWFSGCETVLYRMRLEPATGVLSDFLLFGNTTDAQPPEEIPIIRQTRAEFLSATTAKPPRVVVVTSPLHINGPDDYGKLALWPALEGILATRYTLATEWRPARPERWWSREEYPDGYRIYVLKAAATR